MYAVTDEHLQDLIKGGEYEQAFRLLVREFKRPLYYKLREMLPSHEDADDVLQNTFVKVWRFLPQFKGNSKVYSWCYRIAINECLQWIERQKKYAHLSGEFPLEGVVDASGVAVDGAEILALLNAAIASLPPQQQRVFQLKYFEYKKYDEIAQELNVSIGGLKASYHHAVKKVEAFIKLHAMN